MLRKSLRQICMFLTEIVFIYYISVTFPQPNILMAISIKYPLKSNTTALEENKNKLKNLVNDSHFIKKAFNTGIYLKVME